MVESELVVSPLPVPERDCCPLESVCENLGVVELKLVVVIRGEQAKTQGENPFLWSSRVASLFKGGTPKPRIVGSAMVSEVEIPVRGE